jgi:hypothetical protein
LADVEAAANLVPDRRRPRLLRRSRPMIGILGLRAGKIAALIVLALK